MHYFFEDLLGLAAATPLAVLLMLVPGFGLARLLAQAGLVRDEGAGRTCWGLLLGPVLLPAVDALMVRWLGFGAMLVLHLGLAGFGAGAAWETVRRVPARWWAAAALAWAATAWANVDFDWNGRLYQSQYVVDTVKHAAVVASLAQHGIPLQDPFFARPGPSGYYYYFYIAPALIHWVAGAVVDSRAAFAAASFATLLAFAAMLLLVAQEAALIAEGTRRRFVGTLLFLCCLSGFDLLPGLWMWLQYGRLMADLDWWSEEIRWTLSSILFEPHHMTAVMAVFAGAVLLSSGERTNPLRAVLAGLAFATAFGSSVWIVVGAAPVLALWWLWERAKLGTANMWALPLSGVAALLVSLPQITDIRSGRAPSGPPLAFFVRPVGPVRVLPHGFGEWISHLAVLPGGYLIEFGVFALGAIAFLTRGRLAESRATSMGRLLLVSAPVALLLVTFVRSSVMYNDFGWRAVWLAQLPALLWTASILSARREPLLRSPAWSIAVALGLATMVWDMAGLRLACPGYCPGGFVNANPGVDYDSRGAYRWIDRTVPASVLVQHDPAAGARAMDFGLYSDRPVAVADGDARLFGAAEPAVQSRIALLAPVFQHPLRSPELRQRAAQAGVGGFILTRVDPLWRASNGPPRDWTCDYRSAHSCVMLLEKPR